MMSCKYVQHSTRHRLIHNIKIYYSPAYTLKCCVKPIIVQDRQNIELCGVMHCMLVFRLSVCKFKSACCCGEDGNKKQSLLHGSYRFLLAMCILSRSRYYTIHLGSLDGMYMPLFGFQQYYGRHGKYQNG
jgi:hypothetical protein